MSFSSDLKDFNQTVEVRSEKVFRGTVLALYAGIMKRTPVGNPDNWIAFDQSSGTYKPYELVYGIPEGYIGGTARGNWQTDINRPADSVIDDQDKTGAKGTAKAKSEAMRAQLGDSVFIINNLPYIKRLEDGWSGQAPNGMVKVTASEFTRIVNREAGKAKTLKK